MDSDKADKTKIYNIWYDRMLEDGLGDNQLWRLYTLGIVARRCGVRKSIIARDLRILQSAFSRLQIESTISLSECEGAFEEGYNEPKYDRFSYWLLCALAHLNPECSNAGILEEAFPVVEELPPLRKSIDDLSPEDIVISQRYLFPEMKLEDLKERLKRKK